MFSILTENRCNNSKCQRLIDSNLALKRQPIQNVYEFDIEQQIKDIAIKEWSTLLKYKGNNKTIFLT